MQKLCISLHQNSIPTPGHKLKQEVIMAEFMENKRQILDGFRGAILGLAVGDTMGCTPRVHDSWQLPASK